MIIFIISKTEGRFRTQITIDGQLTCECVQTAETYCREALSLGKQVHVILRDVPSVDEAGWALLKRLAASGCRLRAGGPYNSYIVRTLQPVKASKQIRPTIKQTNSDETERKTREDFHVDKRSPVVDARDDSPGFKKEQ